MRDSRLTSVSSLLAARLGRKKGKMNLEKTINKNAPDVSSAIRDLNPMQPTDRAKLDQPEASTLISPRSPPTEPKLKLATQFKRAINLMAQGNDTTNSTDSPAVAPSSLQPSRIVEKSSDAVNLISLPKEPSAHRTGPTSSSPPIRPPDTRVSSRGDSDSASPSAATVLIMEPPMLQTRQPKSPPSRRVKPSLPHLQSSILQGKQLRSLSPTATSSSATLSPTLTSSSSAMGTGEIIILETNL